MKMSDYILEQDISSASVMDIELQQAYAEMEVACALMDCYMKRELIMEYASCDVSEFGIFMESEDPSDSMLPEVGGKFVPSQTYENITDPKAENIKKKWWQKLLDWLKSLFKAIAMTFAKKSPKKCLYYLDKCPDDAAFDFPLSTKYVCEKYTNILKAAENAVALLESKDTNPEAYNRITKAIESSMTYMNDKHDFADKVRIGKDKLRDVLANMEAFEVSKRVQVLGKKLDALKNSDFVAISGDANSDSAKESKKRIVDAATKMVKTVGAAVGELNTCVIDIFDKVIRTTYKESKKKD